MSKSGAAALAAALGALVAAFAALAQGEGASPRFAPPNLTPDGVRDLAAGCAMCHGTEGRPVPGSGFAGLAGRPAASIVAAMKAYREGDRQATVMQQIAKGYTDAEIAALAEYFAKRAP